MTILWSKDFHSSLGYTLKKKKDTNKEKGRKRKEASQKDSKKTEATITLNGYISSHNQLKDLVSCQMRLTLEPLQVEFVYREPPDTFFSPVFYNLLTKEYLNNQNKCQTKNQSR